MGKVIDSSIFIAAERSRASLDEILSHHSGEPMVMSAITASELLHGVHRAARQQQRSRRQAFVEQCIATLAVIPFDLTVARIHAEIWAKTVTKGISIGAHDLMIAATAIKDFSRIPGLSVVEW